MRKWHNIVPLKSLPQICPKDSIGKDAKPQTQAKRSITMSKNNNKLYVKRRIQIKDYRLQKPLENSWYDCLNHTLQ